MSVLGDNIRKFRKMKEMSQEELAKSVGKSKNVISNWERGDNRPDADTIAILCSVLETTPNFLMGWYDNTDMEKDCSNNVKEDDSLYTTKNFITIAAHADDDLTEEELQKVKEYIKFLKSQRGE